MKLALALVLLVLSLTDPAATTDPVDYDPSPVSYDTGVLADQPPSPVAFVGRATWYDAGRHGQSSWYTREGVKYYGAIGPAVRAVKRHHWRTSWEVRITSLLTGRSIVVQVVDVCGCRGARKVKDDDRLIDLAPAVWQALGVPLGRGVMPIVLEVLP